MHNSPARERIDQSITGMMMPIGMPIGIDALIEMQRPALSTMAVFNARLIEGITTLSSEWVGFVNTRLNEDLAVTRQFADCKSAQDVYGVYADFFQTAVTQYQAEFEQMSKIGKTIADDTIHAVQDRFEDVGQDGSAA